MSSSALLSISNAFTTMRSALLNRSCTSSASRLMQLSNNPCSSARTYFSRSSLVRSTSISSLSNVLSGTTSLLRSRYQDPVIVRGRMVTSNSNGGGDDEKGTNSRDTNTGSNIHVQNDPYGVHYHDGDQGVGPVELLPPRYKRDPTTGMTTSDIHTELTPEDQRLLKLTRQEKVRIYQKRVEESFDGTGKEQKLLDVVSSDDMEKSRAIRERHPDRKEWEKLKKKYYYLLKEREKRAGEKFYEKKQRHMTEHEKEYRKFLQSHGLVDDEEEDRIDMQKDAATEGVEDVFYGVPTYDGKKKMGAQERQQQQKLDQMEHPDKFPSNPWEGENLAWVAQDVSLYSQDDIFMPPELSRVKKVNRRLATPLPKEFIHHNNLDLLRRYTTPGGQIKNRIQTRLGAKDQRKIAKLVKRARAMGLIPYSGQWKVKDDGDMFDPTLDQMKDWEQVYQDAGLIGNRFSYHHTKKAPFTKEEEDNLLRKARSLGLHVDAEGNIPLLEELKNLEKKLMIDSKTLLAELSSKEDSSRPA
jgi:ribosomal protein S18